MAITIGSRVDANFYSGLSLASASIAWTSGTLFVLPIITFGTAPPIPTSIAGATMTFTRIAGCDWNGLLSSAARVSLWVALGNGNTEAVTISTSESEADGFYEICAFSLTAGSWANAAAAIRQSATPTAAATANPSLTLAALNDANSVGFGFLATTPNTAITVGAGFTNFGGFGHGAPVGMNTNGEAKANVTTVNWTLVAQNWTGIAVEIAAPSSAPVFVPQFAAYG